MNPSSTETASGPPDFDSPNSSADSTGGGLNGSQPGNAGGFLTGRSGLIVPLVLAGLSTYLVFGMVTMNVPENTDFPGPRFYPLLLAIAGYVLAVLLVLDVLRKPEHREPEDSAAYRFHSDWKAVAWLVGGFLVFALGIEFLGWIIAGALLFWCVARGVGSKRPVFDISLALVFSSLIYLGFSVGLGLSLPSGLLGGI
ncbi:tripartite tricarboxylate transporter TctB family protein [Kocuria sp.]|uniref:tripartite tricarboxylate transporter TctB family protein n=1 Tax=Kocuria sp. TaxID=1871328 RepID=UPI0026E0D75A|nr:tripartite tricarboxylate transporter TctB family protein [Kocuria sp.]MDO5619178.1 tripartite tricarboxylate transporter TctB family protein [Kocuria sp.]